MSDSIENVVNDLLSSLAIAGGKNAANEVVDATCSSHDLSAAFKPPTVTNSRDDGVESLVQRSPTTTNKIERTENSASANTWASAASVEPLPRSSPSVANRASQQSNFASAVSSRQEDEFFPVEPRTVFEAGLIQSDIETLIVKLLLAQGEVSGHVIAEQICLPFLLVENILVQLKSEQVVGYKGMAPMNDYVYQLTCMGRERACRFNQTCSYVGAAPVTLKDYAKSVRAQSLEHQHPSEQDLKRAFKDLFINRGMLSRLGPAIQSGRGLFLYGPPGNGKTSIAERVTAAFGKFIWIPKAVGIEGEILRVYDPNHHVCAPEVKENGYLMEQRIDQRWIQIRRPTIVVGGELTMKSLDVAVKPFVGICEAPLQMKANCGTLLIDDFGRQSMRVDELLNRWIVPLEKRYDFLNLPNGKMIQIPFDELLIFATNLEPKDLVDEAFLRRIPYKIEVTNPTVDEFRQLFKIKCCHLGFRYDDAAVQYLIDEHFLARKRSFRCCHPRDLLLQICNYCQYHQREFELTPEYFDFAVENYFAVV